MALLTSLVSYWKLDEASGTREDIHSTNDLTDNNTVGSAAGVINNGADFEKANLEYLSIADASQSGLDLTGDFSISLWLSAESAPSNDEWTLVGKHGGTNTTRSYLFRYKDTSGTKALSLRVSSDGTSTNQTESKVSTDLGTATLKHVVITYTASAGEVRFYVNGSQVGATQTGARTSVYNGQAAFELARSQNGADEYDGIIDEVGVWSKVLTGSEITELYNAGAGLAYPFTTGTTVNPSAQVLAFSLPAETVTGAARVSVSAQALTFPTPAETVQANWKVNVGTQVATFSIPAYIITAGGIVVAPSARALSFSLPAETILGNAIVSPNGQSLTFSIPASTVAAGWKVSVSPVVLTITLPTLQFVGALWGRTARTTTGADWTRSQKNNDA